MKVGILFSGRGSNMSAIIRAAIDPSYEVEIAAVVCNRPNAPGIEIAREQGHMAIVIDHREFDRREDHENAVSAALKERGVQLVCLAGYMRILSETFLTAWRGRVVNVHPSLLPAFRGVDTHERALERGCRIHGCTVHYVNAELDGGPIIAQAAVPILGNDDADALSERVLACEHELYPECIAMIARGEVRWSNGSVVISRKVSSERLSLGVGG